MMMRTCWRIRRLHTFTCIHLLMLMAMHLAARMFHHVRSFACELACLSMRAGMRICSRMFRSLRSRQLRSWVSVCVRVCVCVSVFLPFAHRQVREPPLQNRKSLWHRSRQQWAWAAVRRAWAAVRSGSTPTCKHSFGSLRMGRSHARLKPLGPEGLAVAAPLSIGHGHARRNALKAALLSCGWAAGFLTARPAVLAIRRSPRCAFVQCQDIVASTARRVRAGMPG